MTPTTPTFAMEGPTPRMMTRLDSFPVMMNPPIITPSPVSTLTRVEILSGCAAGLGLGDGLVPGEGDGLVPGEGDGLVPGEGDGLVPGEGDGLVPGLGDGLVPGLGDGLVPGLGDGLIPGLGDGLVPGEGLGDGPTPVTTMVAVALPRESSI